MSVGKTDSLSQHHTMKVSRRSLWQQSGKAWSLECGSTAATSEAKHHENRLLRLNQELSDAGHLVNENLNQLTASHQPQGRPVCQVPLHSKLPFLAGRRERSHETRELDTTA